MTGYRKEAYYINTYGPEVGREKYEKAVKARDAKKRREIANRSIILGDDLEAEIISGNAIRCEECGYIGTSIKWSHFKYKCTIKTTREYKEKYPAASLMAAKLRLNQCITLQSLTALYGKEEGEKRWKVYCDKQAETNTLKYKQEKYGMTEEEFNEFNKSRSITLENLVSRHGEDIGTQKWEAYCERQSYTTSLEYFIEEYGEVEGQIKYDSFIDGRNLKGKSEIEAECYNALLQHIPELVFQYKVAGVAGACDMGYSDIVIEFFGQYWHADPVVYDYDWFHSHKKCTAQEIWDKDAKKISRIVATHRHYTIWERDYRKDMDKTISNVLEWINGTDQTGNSRQSGTSRTA